MSKWCDTCSRNEVTDEWNSCSSDCPAFGKHLESLAKIVISVKEILIEAEIIADNQEFGLSYGQAIDYLDKIKDIIK